MITPELPSTPRPKRLPWRWIIAGAITLFVVMIFGVIIWFVIAIGPADRSVASTVTYELKPGTSVSAMSGQLEAKKIIRNATAFTWYVTLKGLRSGLQAGTYELSPKDSTAVIADTLGHGRVAQNKVVVPEGVTVMKVRQLAAAKGIDAAAFDAALGADYKNEFLKGRLAGDASLEGYLFPDTYELPKSVSAQVLIQTMLNNFETKVGATDVRQGFAAHGMTLHQGLTLASIVEREVPHASDRAMVASVFMNRLRTGMGLESDVTVEYAAELNNTTFNLSLNSPYNTYVAKGLPPGPICNPSIDAMKAVAHPQENDYIYFLAGKDGVTHYAKTFAEHQQNIDHYLK